MNVILVIMDTLRRDHLSCYGTEKSSSHLSKTIETPNLDKFAARGTIFDQAYLGSFPCMPARRDFWTGRYEFPFRGWGPLEDDDLEMFHLLQNKGFINMLVSDHYHILEQDAGNYHFGFNGWDMIRGQEHDPYVTEPLEDGTKEDLDHTRSGAWYLHQKNIHGQQRVEEDLYAPRVFRRAVSWLENNANPKVRENRPFCLLVECFDPHEPWDPPFHRVESFNPGYQDKFPHSPVYGTAERFTEVEIKQMRAMYSAELTLVDHWFGHFMNTIDQLNLWEDTLMIVTTDHGFFLGEHNLIGKPDLVPLYNEMSHIPLLAYHPEGKPGTHSKELVQLVDIFPTVNDALNIKLPTKVDQNKPIVGRGHRKAWEGVREQTLTLHGKSLVPFLKGNNEKIRNIAVTGKFGDIIRVTDGEWSLYLSPDKDRSLYWYGKREPGRTFTARRSSYDPQEGRYNMLPYPFHKENELYNLVEDPTEENNVISEKSNEEKRLRALFLNWLKEIEAPSEVAIRYGCDKIL
ncbi:sulfatase [Halalkalibacter kiskunsagensis]|uniref:Sulfatase n=1 Tax=Halalkalibacter kiskunsagensis TaxID=1548599 RepID=A0ABV6KFL1_9BACI